jgi:hypothetical protein
VVTSLAILASTGVLGLVAVVVMNGRGRGLEATVVLAIVVVAGVFLAAYLSASSGPDHPSCSDCQRHLGRYWDPTTATLLALVGLGGLLAGSSIGALGRLVVRGIWLRFRQDGHGSR